MEFKPIKLAPTIDTYSGIEVAAILECRTALDYSAIEALCWFKRFSTIKMLICLWLLSSHF